MTKTQQSERDEAIARLRETLKPGDTVYTVLRSVSRSGMTRGIDAYKIEDGTPIWLSGLIARAGLFSLNKHDCLSVGGCGMDMGFHVVDTLSYMLYGGKTGYKCLGKGKCPSNYHTNHRDTLHCHGGEDATGDHVPCFADDAGVYRLRTRVGDNFGLGDVCPTCKGKGSYRNPEGKERFNLTHTDGYALRHRWM